MPIEAREWGAEVRLPAARVPAGSPGRREAIAAAIAAAAAAAAAAAGRSSSSFPA